MVALFGTKNEVLTSRSFHPSCYLHKINVLTPWSKNMHNIELNTHQKSSTKYTELSLERRALITTFITQHEVVWGICK